MARTLSDRVQHIVFDALEKALSAVLFVWCNLTVRGRISHFVCAGAESPLKSVLVVAGAFKRAEPDLAEDALLMRALRDFNIPKIVREDEVVFFGLLGEETKEFK